MPAGALALLHPRLEDVPVAARELGAGPLVQRAEGRPVARVELLDELERPAVGDHVAADQLAVEVVGEVGARPSAAARPPPAG
jgi:hypothetical protein